MKAKFNRCLLLNATEYIQTACVWNQSWSPTQPLALPQTLKKNVVSKPVETTNFIVLVAVGSSALRSVTGCTKTHGYKKMRACL